MAGVERRHVPATEPLHHSPGGTGFGRGDEHVNVVVHQRVGIQRAATCRQSLAENDPVVPPISNIEEAGQAVVAALDHVLGNAREVEAGKSGHAGMMRGRQRA